MTLHQAYEPELLPDGVTSRHVDNRNGLVMHLLEAGDPGRPALLLLHGFPELAYSWRKVMPALAEAGYHVLAPDLRATGAPWAGARWTGMPRLTSSGCSTPCATPSVCWRPAGMTVRWR